MQYTKFTLWLLALLFLAACQSNESPTTASLVRDTQQVIPVRVEPVPTLETVAPILTSGRVAAQEEIRLAFKIGGIIRALYVEEGASVRKGQLLARLDATEIDAQVRQARQGLAKSQRDLERVKKLYADSVATLEQVQDLTTALEVAEASLEIATFNQQYASIYAPTAGKILRRFAETGEMIGPGTPVFYLASSQGRQVIKVGLPDVEVVRIQDGDPATVQFDAWPGESFPAQVSEIAAGADPMTGTFAVELALKPAAKTLKNGFVGKVEIRPNRKEIFRQVPMGALVEAGPAYASFYLPKADQQSVSLHTIAHYEIQNDHLLVPASEWGGASQVVTRGAKYLRPDSPIRIVGDEKGIQPEKSLSLKRFGFGQEFESPHTHTHTQTHTP
jgi:multidrug efflux system membrane fusion protein